MKKEITLFLIVLMCLTIASSVIANDNIAIDSSKCRDSDGGINYGKFGTASYINDNGVYYEAEDGCVLIQACDTCGPYGTKITSVDSCSGEECYLSEVYCYSTNNFGADKSQKCSKGCDEGFCKEIDITSSTEILTTSDSVEIASTAMGTYMRCVPNAVLMKRMNLLLEDISELDESETSEKYHEQIRLLKEEISIDLEKCNNNNNQALQNGNLQLNSVSSPIAEQITDSKEWDRRTDTQIVVSTSGTVKNIDVCGNLEKLKEKYAYYEKLLNMNDKELSENGWENKDRIKEILKELEEYKRKATLECEGKVDDSNMHSTEIPIAPESGNEITTYYKNKVTDVMSEDSDSGVKITALKQLKKEIDVLIEDLIRSREDIDSKEISELVEKIKITPGKINADGIIVKTFKKSIVKEIDNKEIKIIPSDNEVTIEDEINGKKLEIKAQEISIEENKLRVGNSEVNIMASKIIENLNLNPNKIELKEMNNKAVYEIEVEETGKLFAFIPIKFNEKLIVNAGDLKGEVIKESGPAFGFLIAKDNK